MYSLSLNIINKRNVINPTPYMYVSDDLQSIINEVRKLIKDIIWEQYDNKGASMKNFKASMIIWTSLPSNVHICDVKCHKIREVQKLIIEKEAKNKYYNIMENIKK